MSTRKRKSYILETIAPILSFSAICGALYGSGYFFVKSIQQMSIFPIFMWLLGSLGFLFIYGLKDDIIRFFS